MVLSNKQIHDVCLLGQGANQCRYLQQDALDPHKFHCYKKFNAYKQQVDVDRNALVRQLKERSVDPRKMDIPLGDHCEGYIILHNTMQGHDV